MCKAVSEQSSTFIPIFIDCSPSVEILRWQRLRVFTSPVPSNFRVLFMYEKKKNHLERDWKKSASVARLHSYCLAFMLPNMQLEKSKQVHWQEGYRRRRFPFIVILVMLLLTGGYWHLVAQRKKVNMLVRQFLHQNVHKDKSLL